VQNISLALQEHDLVCIVGASGCGKTTLLRAVAGLIPVRYGRILLESEQITRPSSRTAMIFQHFGLFPWKTVRANIEYGLSVQGKRDRDTVIRLLKVMKLSDYADYYPYQLSGGMQQRVGIARALAVQPEVLLLDEPFSAVDAITREMLQSELLSLWQDPQHCKMTAMLVTHDLDEAILLGDRIVVLHGAPAQVCLDIKVPIPRPRTSQDFRFHPAYPQLRNQIWKALNDGYI
jgi:NitT/TauT family transport system ATP-binding protein